MSTYLVQSKISSEDFKLLLHPTEESRFDLALFFIIPVVGIGLIWILETVAFVLFFIVGIIVLVWFTMQILKANLTSNAVKVSEINFPELHDILREVKYVLDYERKVEIYIVDDGTVNAFLAKFLQTEIIVLNSELVEDMLKKDTLLQAKWVIARFVGALKAKHTRFFLIRVIINSLEKLQIFNLFLLPYERAIKYSGDRIGLAVCGDLNQAMLAFHKFMIGNELSGRINPRGILEQEKDMGFFAAVSRLFSAHPHVVDRFFSLLSFAEQRYPEMYKSYMSKLK